jgi:hypothetical protein
MDWHNQHSENGYVNKSNPHVQCNHHQNFINIHHRGLEVNYKVCMEAQTSVNRQGNTEQKEQYWRYHNTLYQTIYYRAVTINTAW